MCELPMDEALHQKQPFLISLNFIEFTEQKVINSFWRDSSNFLHKYFYTQILYEYHYLNVTFSLLSYRISFGLKPNWLRKAAKALVNAKRVKMKLKNIDLEEMMQVDIWFDCLIFILIDLFDWLIWCVSLNVFGWFYWSWWPLQITLHVRSSKLF